MAIDLGSAASGAATGAALGTVIPGVGNLIGAGIGGLGGLIFGGNDEASLPQLTNPVGDANMANANGMSSQAIAQQQAFLQALQAQGGIGNQTAVFNQQQQLADQLAQMAAGQGPNPALAQLNQATGQNVANQAALMGSQRGAGANAGLIARQASMQGANIQQQAAGQGAIMQAQQQLAATQALQQQQAAMASLASNQVGNLGAAGNSFANSALGQQNAFLNAYGNYNNAMAGGQSSVNQAAAQQKDRNDKAMAGGISGVGTALAAFAGGDKTKTTTTPNYEADAAAGHTPKYFDGGLVKSGKKSGAGAFLTGDFLSAAMGAEVPGKAQVKGDSPKNDTVPAVLSPGEVVLPRSVMNSKDPAAAASKFVKAIMDKKRKSKKD